MPFTQRIIKSHTTQRIYADVNTLVTIISISDNVAIVDDGKERFPCCVADLGDEMKVIAELVKEIVYDLFNQR